MSRHLIQVEPQRHDGCLLHTQAASGSERTQFANPIDALDQIEHEGGTSVLLFGEEPTNHEALNAWLSHGKRVGLKGIGIQTNGRKMADTHFLESLVESGLTSLDVSIMGSQDASHDYHTGVQGSFVETIRGIEHSRRIGLRIGVTTPVTRSNYRELTSVVERCIAMKVEAIHFSFIRASGQPSAYFLRFVPRFQMVLPHLVRAARLARSKGLPVFLRGMPFCIMGASAAACLEVHHGVGQRTIEPEDCRGCSLQRLCPGISPQYEERFGSGELNCAAIDLDRLSGHAQPMSQGANLFAGVAEIEAGFHG